MLFIDWFAGIGGFRRGLELAGHKCIGFCEYDKYAVASYTSMHLITKEQAHYLKTLPLKQRQKEILKSEYRNGEWYAKDISEVKGTEIPKADIWCGGFPCQDISVAGKQKGLKGERSNLFYQFIRCLKEQEQENKPEWIILENVKNLLSVNAGWDFAKVLFALGKVGYNVGWQVFNSKDYGVPQNRERVYLVGHLRGTGRRKIFPITGTNGENSIPINQIGKYESNVRDNPQRYRTYDVNGCSPSLQTYQGGGLEPCVAIPISKCINGREIEIANTITAREDRGVSNRKDEGTAVAIPVLTPDRAIKRQNGRRFKENNESMFTLTAQDKHGVAITTNNSEIPVIWYEKYNCYIAIRKLTPKECFRLQGWEDKYFNRAKFVNSDSQLYKQAGNGVTVKVVKVIGEALNGYNRSNKNRCY